MDWKNFLPLFLAGCIGVLIYKFITYLIEPYDPQWVSLTFKTIVAAIVMAVGILFLKAAVGDDRQ